MKSTDLFPGPIDYFPNICPVDEKDCDLKLALNVCMHVVLHGTDHALRFKAIEVVRDAWAYLHGKPKPDYECQKFAETLEIIFGTKRKQQALNSMLDEIQRELERPSLNDHH